jgi:molecular chaperone DnaK
MAYSVEKLLEDNDDKLPDDVKSEVRADVDALKTALAGTDDAAVDAATERLQASQGKLGEAIYANQADAPAEDAPESTKDDEDIIDAEVVDDEDDKEAKDDKDATK